MEPKEDTADTPDTPDTPDTADSPDTDTGNESFRAFPLFLYGVLPGDVPDVVDVADIVYNNSAFVPSADNHTAFQKPITDAMLDAVAAHGLRIAAQLPLLANRSLRYALNLSEEQRNALKGNGVLRSVGEEGDSQVFELYDETNTVQIPLDQSEVTAEYIEWVLPRLEEYILSLLAHPHSDRIEYWWGIEEIRSYRGAGSDYDLERQVRALIDRVDPDKRPLVSYMSASDDPPKTLALSLLAGSHTANPLVPTTLTTQDVEVNPNNAVWIDWHDPDPTDSFDDYGPKPAYPIDIQVWQDSSSGIIPIHTHLLAGNYVPEVLQPLSAAISENEVSIENYAQENRIWSYHQIERLLEARWNARQLMNDVGENGSNHLADTILFHMPSLTSTNESSLAQARHDFWSGVHKAEGIAIYAYSYRNSSGQQVWSAYENGLRLIKSDLRFFLNSQRQTLPVTVTSANAVTMIPGENYDQIKFGMDVESHQHLLGYVPEYPSLNATITRKNNVAYLIVTHSLAQAIEFKIDCGTQIQSMERVIGEGAESTYEEHGFMGSFDGIDAQVYRINFH
jgi:hypothetical protein